jgi:hypothetical protein
MKQLSPEVKRKLELAAYAAIVIAGLGIAVWLVRPSANSTKVEGTGTLRPGSKLGEPTDWAAYDRTLVLILRKGCHYCAASAPFYRRLAGLIGESGRVHLTAVLPHPVPEAKEYLARQGLEIEDIRQANLASLRIAGTPTLLLVDKRGTVRMIWVGKLPDEGETQVLLALGLTNTQSR